MFRPTCLLLAGVAALLLAPALLAEEDPTPNDVATDYAKAYKKNYKKMPVTDAMEGIDKLVAFYNDEKVDDKKAKKAILDALSKPATDRDAEVRAKVMKKAGEMDDGIVMLVVKVLQLELKKKVPEDSVYEAALTSLGKLQSSAPAAVKTLTDLLKNNDDTIVARAARAIAGYAGAPGKIRTKLFEEVLKASEGPYSQAQQQNERQKRKWNIIKDDSLEALNKLSVPPNTGKFTDPTQARAWFNDNKKASWDKAPR